MTTTTNLSPHAQSVLDRVLALREASHRTLVVTARSQNKLLQLLRDDSDLSEVCLRLSQHQKEFGW